MRQPGLIDDPNAPAIFGKPNCPVGFLVYLHRPFHRQEWEISLYRAVIRLGRGSDRSHHKGLMLYWIMCPLSVCMTAAASLCGIGGTVFFFAPILENFPFWKTRSWEIRIGRQANSGVVREPSAFRLAKFQQFSSLTSHRHGQNSGNAKRKEKPEDPTSRPVKLLPCAQSKQTEFLLRSAGAQHTWMREIRSRYRSNRWQRRYTFPPALRDL